MNDNNYNPNEIESKWYKKWECSGVFDSIPNKQKAFTITMPPSECNRRIAYGTYFE